MVIRMKKLNLKCFSKNDLNRNVGITLIALVISIVVLLILAGISINTLTGDNGILKHVVSAKEKNEEAEEKEGVQLAVTSSIMDEPLSLKLTKDNLEKAIKQQFRNNIDYTITENGDGSFTIKFNNTNRTYYIEETGNVIENNDILKISNANELKDFRDEVNNGNTFEGIYVYLTNDINLNIEEEWQPIGRYLKSNTSISANTNTPFRGTFDGKGHEISGIKITNSENDKGEGLFGLVMQGTIKNVGIGENCNIYSINVYGGIAGFSNSNTIIENCYNKAKIILDSSGIQTGGIVGNNGKNCIISKCYNLAEVNGVDNVGGIVGFNCGNIDKCYNGKSAFLNSTISNIGGIAGYCSGIVSNSYNRADLSTNGNNIGGISGGLFNNDYAKVLNSYSTGNITSSTGLGNGVVGAMQKGSVENSFYIENTINASNGSIIVDGTTYLSESELKSYYNILGSAFKKDTNNINDGYPILAWQ